MKKLISIFILIIIGFISFANKIEYSEEFISNIHNWRIYYNDSIAYLTINTDFPNRDKNVVWHKSYLMALNINEIKAEDIIRIEYYSDYYSTEQHVSLIVVKDSLGNQIGHFYDNQFKLKPIVDAHPNIKRMSVFYTDILSNEDKGKASERITLTKFIQINVKG